MGESTSPYPLYGTPCIMLEFMQEYENLSVNSQIALVSYTMNNLTISYF